jgi:hypothetical protein
VVTKKSYSKFVNSKLAKLLSKYTSKIGGDSTAVWKFSNKRGVAVAEDVVAVVEVIAGILDRLEGFDEETLWRFWIWLPFFGSAVKDCLRVVVVFVVVVVVVPTVTRRGSRWVIFVVVVVVVLSVTRRGTRWVVLEKSVDLFLPPAVSFDLIVVDVVTVVDLAVVDLAVVDRAVVDLAVVDLAVVDLAVVDFALKTAPVGFGVMLTDVAGTIGEAWKH